MVKLHNICSHFICFAFPSQPFSNRHSINQMTQAQKETYFGSVVDQAKKKNPQLGDFKLTQDMMDRLSASQVRRKTTAPKRTTNQIQANLYRSTAYATHAGMSPTSWPAMTQPILLFSLVQSSLY